MVSCARITDHGPSCGLATLLLAAFSLALCGCSRPDPAPAVQRFAEQGFALDQQREVAERSIPMDAEWSSHDGELTLLEGGLHFKGRSASSTLTRTLDPPLDAAAYNTIEVKMRISQGGNCRLAWSSDLDPRGVTHPDNPAEGVAVLGDREVQTIRFELDGGHQPAWAGLIHALSFSPSNLASESEIESMVFSWRPPAALPRLTLAESVNMPMLFGTRPPWKLRIPPNAVFESHLGLLARPPETNDRGVVRFRAVLETGQDEEMVLVDRKLSPGLVPDHRRWVRVSKDLSAYAGQEVTISLHVDKDGTTYRDYAYWGNPMVFSRALAETSPPSVILISCDTLRADHLPCYGYAEDTAPNLSAWAENEAVIFDNAITPATWTLPSHTTMLTGLTPPTHGVSQFSNLANDVVTLPQLLQQHGYLTAGFTGVNWWFQPWRGIGKGFDLLDIPVGSFRHIYETADHVNAWLSEHGDAPFFLFFHNYDVHGKPPEFEFPYEPGDSEFRVQSKSFKGKYFQKEGMRGDNYLLAYWRGEVTFSEEEHALLHALYDDCIRMVDHQLGQFFERLRQAGVYDNALIIVTADHGESLNERGHYGHYSVYEEVCRVPLLVKFPQGKHAGTRYTPQVSLADLFATVSDVAGIDAGVETEGVSLVQLLEQRAQAHEFTFIEHKERHAVRTNAWKLHWDPSLEKDPYTLYNLEADPGEQEALPLETTPAYEEMYAELHKVYELTVLESEPEGWHIHLMAPDATWYGIYELSSTETITGAYQIAGTEDAVVLPVSKDNMVRVRVGGGINTHVLIKTASSKGVLKLRAQSDQFHAIALGNSQPILYLDYGAVLDPAKESYPKPVLPDHVGVATSFVWHLAGADREAAEAPSEEMVEQLEALGYVE